MEWSSLLKSNQLEQEFNWEWILYENILYNKTKAWEEQFMDIEMILTSNEQIDHPLQPITVDSVWRHEDIWCSDVLSRSNIVAIQKFQPESLLTHMKV